MLNWSRINKNGVDRIFLLCTTNLLPNYSGPLHTVVKYGHGNLMYMYTCAYIVLQWMFTHFLPALPPSSPILQRHEIMRLTVSQNPLNLPELVVPGQMLWCWYALFSNARAIHTYAYLLTKVNMG